MADAAPGARLAGPLTIAGFKIANAPPGAHLAGPLTIAGFKMAHANARRSARAGDGYRRVEM